MLFDKLSRQSPCRSTVLGKYLRAIKAGKTTAEPTKLRRELGKYLVRRLLSSGGLPGDATWWDVSKEGAFIQSTPPHAKSRCAQYRYVSIRTCKLECVSSQFRRSRNALDGLLHFSRVSSRCIP